MSNDWLSPSVILTIFGLFLAAGGTVVKYLISARDELDHLREDFANYKTYALEKFVSHEFHGQAEGRLVLSMSRLERAVEKLSDRLEKLLERG